MRIPFRLPSRRAAVRADAIRLPASRHLTAREIALTILLSLLVA